MTLPARPLCVVDTNVLGYLYRKDPLADSYAAHLEAHSNVIAFQTLAEIRFGMEKASWGARRKAEQEQFLSRFRTVYPSDRLCTFWATAMIGARRAGQPIDTTDAWIAATALALKCPLVTHNAADFVGVPDLSIISEQSA